MKSGPALRQLASHRAIHDAAHSQAKELTEITTKLFTEGRSEDCLKTANVLIEHWEEKIIAHADAEDEGLYEDLLEEGNIPKKNIYMLMRDHDLFRKIVAHIKTSIKEQNEVTQDNIYELQSLIVINNFHHQGEETHLFPNEKRNNIK